MRTEAEIRREVASLEDRFAKAADKRDFGTMTDKIATRMWALKWVLKEIGTLEGGQ